MADYSEAIALGVQRWMEANKNAVLEALSAPAEKAGDNAAQLIASGVMLKVGKFLDENRAEIVTATAAAIAASYRERQFYKMEGA